MREINLYSGEIIKNNNGPIDEGNEGEIYFYSNPKYYDNHVVLKRLRTWKNFIEYDIPILGNFDVNKRQKIEKIENMSCFKDEVKILDAVIEFGKFIGYTMEICPYNQLDINVDTQAKINYLKAIREKVKLLNSEGAFVGDFNSTNFLVDKKSEKLVMCDLDNFRIGNLDFDVKHRFVTEFNSKCDKRDYVDSYALNLFTIALLSGLGNAYVLEHLSEISLPNEINTKENRNILDSMNNLDNSYQPRFLMDNLN